jgi:hypothetical protein
LPLFPLKQRGGAPYDKVQLDTDPMEDVMNTKLIIAAASALTASSALLAPTAQAHGHGGFGRFFFRSPPPVVYAAPTERTYRIHRRIRHVYRYVDKPADEAIVAYVDSHGRQFDFASKVWFDGTSQCWSGKRAFLFKGGSWFYGNTPWQQSGGTWQTTAADAPAPVACETAAVFATKIQPVAARQPVVLKTDKVEPTKVSSVTAAVDTTTKIAECKKYFPSVGEMVAVPCSE